MWKIFLSSSGRLIPKNPSLMSMTPLISNWANFEGVFGEDRIAHGYASKHLFIAEQSKVTRNFPGILLWFLSNLLTKWIGLIHGLIDASLVISSFILFSIHSFSRCRNWSRVCVLLVDGFLTWLLPLIRIVFKAIRTNRHNTYAQIPVQTPAICSRFISGSRVMLL